MRLISALICSSAKISAFFCFNLELVFVQKRYQIEKSLAFAVAFVVYFEFSVGLALGSKELWSGVNQFYFQFHCCYPGFHLQVMDLSLNWRFLPIWYDDFINVPREKEKFDNSEIQKWLWELWKELSVQNWINITSESSIWVYFSGRQEWKSRKQGSSKT